MLTSVFKIKPTRLNVLHQNHLNNIINTLESTSWSGISTVQVKEQPPISFLASSQQFVRKERYKRLIFSSNSILSTIISSVCIFSLLSTSKRISSDISFKNKNIIMSCNDNKISTDTSNPHKTLQQTSRKRRHHASTYNSRSFYSNSKCNLDPPVSRELKEKPIAIIGGGIGGTALALALQRKGIPFILFEKDECFSARRQGYGLTLQQGVMCMRALGFTSISGGVVSTSHASYSPNGDILGKDGRHNIHLPRQRLRQILIEQISPENIIWNKKFLEYEDFCNEDGVRVEFQDNTSYTCSVLVAADGIYSTIRKQKLPDASLEYLGLMVILGITMNIEFDSGVKKIRQWLDGSNRVFTMPFDSTQTMWQMSFPLDEETAFTISASPESLKEEAIRRCGSWHPDLSRILNSTDVSLVSGHPVYDRLPLDPVILRGQEHSRVTMLGDAVHPMSPFKGQGANQALVDAIALAKAISNSNLVHPKKPNISIALMNYEKEMCSRSAAKVLKSRDSALFLHSTSALAHGNMTRAWVAATNATKT
eukprot:gene8819-18250_t